MQCAQLLCLFVAMRRDAGTQIRSTSHPNCPRFTSQWLAGACICVRASSGVRPCRIVSVPAKLSMNSNASWITLDAPTPATSGLIRTIPCGVPRVKRETLTPYRSASHTHEGATCHVNAFTCTIVQPLVDSQSHDRLHVARRQSHARLSIRLMAVPFRSITASVLTN